MHKIRHCAYQIILGFFFFLLTLIKAVRGFIARLKYQRILIRRVNAVIKLQSGDHYKFLVNAFSVVSIVNIAVRGCIARTAYERKLKRETAAVTVQKCEESGYI